MAANPTAAVKPRSDLTIWQWNCRRFDHKKAVIQQHITMINRKPDVIMLQETVSAAPFLPGYKSHVNPAQGRGMCTFVRKGLTFVEHTIKQGNIKTEYTFTEIIPSKQREGSLFLLNVYSNPKHTHTPEIPLPLPPGQHKGQGQHTCDRWRL